MHQECQCEFEAGVQEQVKKAGEANASEHAQVLVLYALDRRKFEKRERVDELTGAGQQVFSCSSLFKRQRFFVEETDEEDVEQGQRDREVRRIRVHVDACEVFGRREDGADSRPENESQRECDSDQCLENKQKDDDAA